MQLKNYLRKRGETKRQFADRSGLSEAMISLLSRGETWLSRETAQKIWEATEGKVTPTDFLKGAR
jgi:transcriptional regulator with XRE-family HTH domain